MAPRAGWKKVAATVTLTATSFTYSATAVQAFFPPWWPSSPPTTLVPPVVPPPTLVPPVVPPVSPPPTLVPPTVPPPPHYHCYDPCPPNGVPEPSTLVAGLAGLTAAAGWAARRRKAA